MKAGGKDFGNVRIFPVEMGQAQASGGATRISLEKIPSKVGEFIVCVLGFILKLPAAAVTPTASKVLDGLSLAQCISTLTIACSPRSPAAKSLGGHVICNGINGPQALQALAFMSGRPVLLGAGANVRALAAGTADHQTFATALGTPTTQEQDGWFQSCGPFGGVDGTAVEWSDTPRFFLPVGLACHEDFKANAIPSGYFSGKTLGGDECNGSDAGYIEVALASKIDNIAVTFTGTFDVEAVCVLLPASAVPVPVLPKLRRGESSSTRIPLEPGIPAMIMLQKALSAGAQASHDYTTVSLWKGGMDMVESNVARNIRCVNLTLRRREWRVTSAETSQSHASAARFSRWGVPVHLWDDSPLYAIGDDVEGLMLEIVTTGETNFAWLYAYWSGISDAMAAQAKAPEWSGMEGAVAVPATRNGNLVSKAAAAISKVIPNKVEQGPKAA